MWFPRGKALYPTCPFILIDRVFQFGDWIDWYDYGIICTARVIVKYVYCRIADSGLGAPEAMSVLCRDLLHNKSLRELRYEADIISKLKGLLLCPKKFQVDG